MTKTIQFIRTPLADTARTIKIDTLKIEELINRSNISRSFNSKSNSHEDPGFIRTAIRFSGC